jgi:hypothetical protein
VYEEVIGPKPPTEGCGNESFSEIIEMSLDFANNDGRITTFPLNELCGFSQYY